MHHDEVKVGGTYRMSFTNFRTGESHSFSGTYSELSPGTKIRYSDSFDDPNLPGMMHVTVTFTKVLCGTEIQITQENIPSVIPLEHCYLGWQESFSQLANIVEPDIK